eukprot:7557770-Pyramimonas_sp.AAC.1
METWDISTAFLQGLNYPDLKKCADQLGIEVRHQSKVYMQLPMNVWRHFGNYDKSTVHIGDSDCQVLLPHVVETYLRGSARAIPMAIRPDHVLQE